MKLALLFDVPMHIVRFLDQFTRITLFEGVEESKTRPDWLHQAVILTDRAYAYLTCLFLASLIFIHPLWEAMFTALVMEAINTLCLWHSGFLGYAKNRLVETAIKMNVFLVAYHYFS